ncbi:MAG: hypothetical protein AAGG48_14085 [Planctomycetota bacterium]
MTELSTDDAPESSSVELQSNRRWQFKNVRATEFALALIVGAFGFALTYWQTRSIPEILTEERFFDTYFGADFPRAFQDLTTRWTKYGGSTKHPMFCLLSLPSFALQKALSFSAWQAVRALLAVNSFVLTGLLFVLCKQVSGRNLDALLLSLLFLSTGAAVFWLPVPETYAFGATTVVLPLTLLLSRRLSESYFAHVASYIVAISVTLTNVVSAIVVAWLQFGTKKTISISIHAAGVLYVVMSIQTLVIPSSGFIAANEILNQTERYKNRQSLLTNVRHFFLTSVSPGQIELGIVDPTERRPQAWPCVDIDQSRSSETLKAVTAQSRMVQLGQYGVWLVLLIGSFVIFLSSEEKSRLVTACYLLLVAHLLITLKYGNEPFIYPLHWSPLFVICLGSSMRSRFRVVSLVLVFVLICGNFWTNLPMYLETMELLETMVSESPSAV